METTPQGITALLMESAADTIEHDAEALRESHTINRNGHRLWVVTEQADINAFVSFRQDIALAHDLRRAASQLKTQESNHVN